jgi:phosphatidylserine decarboxylase
VSGLKLRLQHWLPQRAMSRAVGWLMTRTWRPWKNGFTRLFIRLYRVDTSEALSQDLAHYPHFNAFFTRALKPGARTPDSDPAAALIPADGAISQLGPVTDGRLLQAKGHTYSAAELLGDAEFARAFEGGVFATVYLSPRDYHRVHMPLAGTLVSTLHVPGRLYSVAKFTVEGIPNLFARNERLVCRFDTERGPMAVVMVGAVNVSGIETVWRGVEVPPYAEVPTPRDYRAASPPIRLERFAEMGRFNMGSTAIVLLPKGFVLDPALAPDRPVRVGPRHARWQPGG